MSFNVKALGAFKKLGAVSLITATIFFTACNQTGNTGGGGTQGAPFVEGGASLILSPDNLTIKVKATTADGFAITVEGCTETTLTSDVETELHAKGTSVVLKGKIIKLYSGGTLKNRQSLTALNVQGCAFLQGLNCVNNQLTSLNVQGLTALQWLRCEGNQLPELNVQGLTALQGLGCSYNKLTELNVQGLTALKELDCSDNKLTSLNVQDCTSLRRLYCTENKLNAQAMTALLNALLARKAGDNAEAVLYAEMTGATEGNCKDFSQPAELKKAFDDAKNRNWKLKKYNANGKEVDI